MSSSTPSDIAVAYRSMVRRRAEAVAAAEGADAVPALVGELDGHLAAAAAALGVAADPTVIAEAIDATPNDELDDATLETLHRHAVDAGGVLRRITDLAPPDEG